MKVIAALALVSLGTPSALSARVSVTDAIIKNLDVTTFPNSLGYGRRPGRSTFADYGFIVARRADRSAYLVRKSDGRTKSFDVLEDGP